MADIVYFSGELTATGEVKLHKQEVSVDYDSAPQIVQVTIHDPLHVDPTLTIFYEPQELDKDAD